MNVITELGIDPIADKLLEHGAGEVSREDWIDFAFFGEPPADWTAELEAQLPECLREPIPSMSAD